MDVNVKLQTLKYLEKTRRQSLYFGVGKSSQIEQKKQKNIKSDKTYVIKI